MEAKETFVIIYVHGGSHEPGWRERSIEWLGLAFGLICCAVLGELCIAAASRRPPPTSEPSHASVTYPNCTCSR